MSASWDRRPAEEHTRAEGLVLDNWLPAAVSFSEHWTERANMLGIDPETLKGREGLARFPPSLERELVDGSPGGSDLVMTPSEALVKRFGSTRALVGIAKRMRGEGDELRRRAILEEYKPIHVHRAGRSDELAIAYTRSDLDRLQRCGARAASVLGLGDTDYLISTIPMAPTLEFFGLQHLAMGASMLAVHPRGAEDELDRVVDGAFDLVPATAVAVRRDEAIELAELLGEHGAPLERVATIVLVGTPPEDEERGEIREAWLAAGASSSVKVLALWAPSTARAMWAESADGSPGLVTYPDLEVLEVVDPMSRVPSQSGGDLVMTSAGWHGSAMLRFQTGVYVGGLEAGGADGRTVPRIMGPIVEHAWQPWLEVKSGTYVVDFRGAVAVMAQRPDIKEWRVEISLPKRGVDQLIVEIGADDDAPHLEQLSAQLSAALGAPLTRLVVDDPADIAARVAALGSKFADLR